MFWWLCIDCIMAKHHKIRSHFAFVFNQCKYNVFLDGTHCVQRLYNPFISINTTNYRCTQLRSGNSNTPAYNTTINTNKLSSHQFTCNVSCNKTAETFFFCSFIVHTIANSLHPNRPMMHFIPVTISFPTIISSTFHD